jgi:hypothetical protein
MKKTVPIQMAVLADITREIDNHGQSRVQCKDIAYYFAEHGYTVRENRKGIRSWVITD